VMSELFPLRKLNRISKHGPSLLMRILHAHGVNLRSIKPNPIIGKADCIMMVRSCEEEGGIKS